jgi:hypothetical protein
MPSQEKIRAMQKILDDFAIGSMNYAKARITMPVEMGGLRWAGFLKLINRRETIGVTN